MHRYHLLYCFFTYCPDRCKCFIAYMQNIFFYAVVITNNTSFKIIWKNLQLMLLNAQCNHRCSFQQLTQFYFFLSITCLTKFQMECLHQLQAHLLLHFFKILKVSSSFFSVVSFSPCAVKRKRTIP